MVDINTSRYKLTQSLRDAFILLFIIIAAAFFVLPFIWVVMISFKRPLELINNPERFLPKSLDLSNYVLLLGERYKFYLFFINSVKVTFISVAGAALTSSLAGYAFARLKFPGRNFIFLLYLSTMMIPPQVTIIPRYLLFFYMGLINTHASLILPAVISVVATFMMRQYFSQIPMELSESAYIDGAGEYRIFFQIIAPLAKPALVSVFILLFSWIWNDYLNPLIFLQRKELYTLPLGVTVFAEENQKQMELVATASTITTVPVLAVFLIAQKRFISGLTAGALKG